MMNPAPGMEAGRHQPANVEARWNARVARARELQPLYPAAAPVLRFYAAVLEFQREVARRAAGRRVAQPPPAVTRSGSVAADIPVREQIDASLAASHILELVALTIASGPETLAARAKSVQRESASQWEEKFRAALRRPPTFADDLTAFFLRACLQPLAELAADHAPLTTSQGKCPACGSDPQAAVLRPEGDGAQRWLLCSFCLREWLFRRLVCASCGEEDKDKLPHYCAESSHVGVEACDTCHRYLKAVDLGVDGHAVPLVDEVALAVLDVWAGQRGYRKIALNLMGL